MKAVLAAALTLVLAQAASSATFSLYAVSAGSDRTFYKVDEATGSGAALGNTGAFDQLVNDIAGDPELSDTTTLYGLLKFSGGVQTSIIGIDEKDGLVAFSNALPVQPKLLAFDNVTRQLYALTDEGASMNLYTIALVGYATQLVATVNQPLNAIEFDQNGVLYGAAGDSMVTINKTSGAVAPLFSDLSLDVTTLAFHPGENVMYGIGSQGANYSLFTIDLGTGGISTIGSTVSQPSGLTFYPDDIVPEPASSTLAVFAIGCGLSVRTRFGAAAEK
ncbi:hypothetical protein [Lacipirellula limnantheis]|uniref:PEP-CTERM protein-sorting domain-containing protein n=1 Tax=Lacipirellula limnantheis TaxID=2528024 RepID=A0A517U6B2_9BACT|nr:hypothetical protein [Lacipirellula limnantheis]QDT76167.1 hypothetical protein I41_54120 [Lacipirellula limnantheis]